MSEKEHPFPGNGLVWADVYIGTGPYDGERREDRHFTSLRQANLLSSHSIEIVEAINEEGGTSFYQRPKWDHEQLLHRPVLDIDLPVKVVPSTTEGHFHLYIDKEMPWSDYVELLEVMAKVGILE